MNNKQIKQLSEIFKNVGLLILGGIVLNNLFTDKANVILISLSSFISFILFFISIIMLGGRKKWRQ